MICGTMVANRYVNQRSEGVSTMSALAGDFTDCTALIYDINGVHLASSLIRTHDREAQQIRVNLMPSELSVNDNCKVFVLSSPTPCEFLGKVKKEGGNLFIAMFQGQEKENRGATRYSVNSPALIDALIVDDKAHNLQTPIKITLINISTSGVRFRAPYYSFIEGDVFQMHLVISNSKKRITAQVINFFDNKTTSSDYGCRFLEIN